jgi:hypothetical protein
MLTREEALKNLNLAPDTSDEAIEQAYRRLVRRYPPEHNPDRFRLLDESYRILTSLAYQVESILLPATGTPSPNLGAVLAQVPLMVGEAEVAQGMVELRGLWLAASLWPRDPAKAADGRPKRGRKR